MAEHFAPNSSNIALVEYDAEQQTMTVEFVSGGRYEYREVPRSVFLGMQSAGSAGAFFRRMVKDQFVSERVG